MTLTGRHALKLAYLLLAALFVALALSRLNPLSLTTDELLEFQGTADHLSFAKQLLQGGKPDLHDAIVYNLENYGIVAKLPAFLIAAFAGMPWPPDYQALAADATPYLLYFHLSHLSTLLFGLASSALLIAVAHWIGIGHAWAAGLILLLMPRFIGDSLFNVKDIPFAFFYLLYSTSLLLRLRFSAGSQSAVPARLFLFAALAAGLMGAIKIVALLPVLISEALLSALLPRRFRWLDAVHLCLDAALLSLLFTPSSWLEPLRFLNSAVTLFRSHDWPGGTWWNGEFLSRVQDPQSWSTAGYLWRWIPSTTPLWILVLVISGAASLVLALPWPVARTGLLSLFAARPAEAVLLLPFLLQLLLLPALAVIGNANLYDGVRHLLFLYPPLALLAAFGLDRLRTVAAGIAARWLFVAGALLLALLAALTFLDGLLLFPYGYVYVNEPMRFLLHPANTSYDYWGYAATPSARAALSGLSARASSAPACLARVELPDPVKALLAPSLAAAACPADEQVDAAASPRQPMVLRLVSGAGAAPPACRSVTRWQAPWLWHTLSTACLAPLPAGGASR